MSRSQLAIVLCCGALLLPSPVQAERLAQIRLEVTDPDGVPIGSIAVGEDFLLRVLVQDVRDPPASSGGVFAAFLNADYDESLVAVDLEEGIAYEPFFSLARTGSLATPGEIVGGGAATYSLSPPGNAEQLLFQVRFEATAPGLALFAPSFDPTAGHDVLLYLLNDPVAQGEVDFIGDSLTITPEPRSLALAFMAGLASAWCGWRGRRGRRFDTGAAAR